MSSHTATWKQHERRTALALGGKRLGATGCANEDVTAPGMAIECKHRETLPAWLTDALAKVRAQAGRERLGLLVLHEAGRHDSIVCMSLSDFVARYGAIPGEPDNGA
jgi:hypothetical protein